MVIRRNGRRLVLCYHAVSERWPSALATTPAAFEHQLRLVLRAGYRAITFSELLTVEATRRTVAITFDDGFRSVLDVAGPILVRLGIPATVFVPTAFPGHASAMRWDGICDWLGTPHEDELAPLDWDELRWLAAQGWEIGSHTCTHPRLTTLDGPRRAAELEESRARIEDQLGRPCHSLAYPYGDVDGAVIAAARRAGYAIAGVVGNPIASNPLAWPRVGVYRHDRVWRFRAKLSPLANRAAARRHAFR